MRCDRCGARNPGGATWCTQCYASFTPHEEPEADAPAPAVTEVPAAAVTDAPATAVTEVPVAGAGDAADGSEAAAPSGDAPASVVEVGDVREHGGIVEWRCRVCASWVALEMPACHACGSPRSGFGDQPRPEASVSVSDRSKVLTAGAIFPGVGHLLAGRPGSGATRLALGLLWLIGGIWWVATTAASGSAPGLVLLVGAVVLWIASYLDVQAIVSGRDEPFGVRGLLWSVVGVTALLMIAVAWLATGPSLA